MSTVLAETDRMRLVSFYGGHARGRCLNLTLLQDGLRETETYDLPAARALQKELDTSSHLSWKGSICRLRATEKKLLQKTLLQWLNEYPDSAPSREDLKTPN